MNFWTYLSLLLIALKATGYLHIGWCMAFLPALAALAALAIHEIIEERKEKKKGKYEK